VTSPQLHRIHHSRLLEHRDKNFAAYFPVWDLVFGTYFHPKWDEYPATGVHDEKDVERLADALVLPFREWSRMFHNWRNGRLRSS
jgi:sterol desaturase/sphingolipid hydroxylase (fatty acid hydroxylase superfamily)